jgi:2-(1,2-epoxy-1,2-dihydrophenyl)acetyl-CoA isomerase
MSDASPALLTREGDVAVITLNRPDAANAMDLSMTAALEEIAERLIADGWARAVVLRANGKLFCAGGDLKAFSAALDDTMNGGLPKFITDLAGQLHRAMLKLAELDAPLVVGFNGAAAGAGMSLVLAGDFVFAGPRAKLNPAYSNLGFSADGGMTWLLPRIVGERKAADILMRSPTLSAEEAQRLGIVTEILDLEGEAFDVEVLARARALAAGPRKAYGVIRRLVRQSAQSSFKDQLDAELKGMATLAATDDLREGVAGLLEKRKPAFRD